MDSKKLMKLGKSTIVISIVKKFLRNWEQLILKDGVKKTKMMTLSNLK